jgi:hypothetical protein
MAVGKPPRSWGGLERIPKTTLSSADTSMQTKIHLRPSRSDHATWCGRSGTSARLCRQGLADYHVSGTTRIPKRRTIGIEPQKEDPCLSSSN